jgi:hypothetical protein
MLENYVAAYKIANFIWKNQIYIATAYNIYSYTYKYALPIYRNMQFLKINNMNNHTYNYNYNHNHKQPLEDWEMIDA